MKDKRKVKLKVVRALEEESSTPKVSSRLLSCSCLVVRQTCVCAPLLTTMLPNVHSLAQKTNVALGTDMMKLKVESEQLKSTRADIEHEIKAATKTHLKAAFKALRKRRKEAQRVPRP